ncbi:GD21463 [Drosophila simulans]|uniref:GD21463 n=1 Tax=Drosophila simulans TaxID=7240 RepID=B4R087_DROSI|nr:GD21463 [Drosophila simulans]
MGKNTPVMHAHMCPSRAGKSTLLPRNTTPPEYDNLNLSTVTANARRSTFLQISSHWQSHEPLARKCQRRKQPRVHESAGLAEKEHTLSWKAKA